MQITKIRLISCCLILSMFILTGCNLIRKATYPEDFTYLENKEIQSSMYRLALSLDKIDRTLQGLELAPTTVQRELILSELKKMENITDNLGAGTQTTNHLLLDQHIDQFRSQVIKARRSIEDASPNYYMAGKLNGGCTGCHINRARN